ncbi:OmpH family outer membrane protein [Halocynthiibacter namhaensis]|uniref:OmpH family outer membrane protein n=1 Tax=Halocynthiibacter namhaensis TaxID=1290553 RepID=UPI0006903AD8|nr:OmpH family outer membrane protein [Halocynthiibacter namhaensis]
MKISEHIPGICSLFLPGLQVSLRSMIGALAVIGWGSHVSWAQDTVPSGAPSVSTQVSTAQSGRPIASLLTIEQDQLYNQSRLGMALEAMLTLERTDLQNENQKIFDALSAEETELVELRKETDQDAFSVLAQAFDLRVQRIRAEQDQKLRDLVRRREDVQKAFFALALPLVAHVTRSRGGLAVIDRRSVILAVENIDITVDVIGLIDTTYPDGQIPEMFSPTPAEPAPVTPAQE